jgi:hypothetical protein
VQRRALHAEFVPHTYADTVPDTHTDRDEHGHTHRYGRTASLVGADGYGNSDPDRDRNSFPSAKPVADDHGNAYPGAHNHRNLDCDSYGYEHGCGYSDTVRHANTDRHPDAHTGSCSVFHPDAVGIPHADAGGARGGVSACSAAWLRRSTAQQAGGF